jgi:carbon-monoxide dehydrogenase medium subunit
MTIRSFELLQPRSLPEAVEMLRKHGDDARPLGGGTTLIILMKQRAVHYPFLVDLQTIPGLNGIAQESDGLRIGALASHRMVELSPVVRQAFPAVAEAFSRIGNVRVRETASVGGNLAHGLSPRSAAAVTCVGRRDRRRRSQRLAQDSTEEFFPRRV